MGFKFEVLPFLFNLAHFFFCVLPDTPPARFYVLAWTALRPPSADYRPKISQVLLFPLSRLHCSFFPSLGGLGLVECWWCLKILDPFQGPCKLVTFPQGPREDPKRGKKERTLWQEREKIAKIQLRGPTLRASFQNYGARTLEPTLSGLPPCKPCFCPALSIEPGQTWALAKFSIEHDGRSSFGQSW